MRSGAEILRCRLVEAVVSSKQTQDLCHGWMVSPLRLTGFLPLLQENRMRGERNAQGAWPRLYCRSLESCEAVNLFNLSLNKLFNFVRRE
jgi:hypothetical protein